MIVALAITSISTGGCAPATSHTQRASTQAAHESSARTLDLLRVLGAKSAYVMAGDDLLHSGLGVLDEQGLAPATVQPAVPLMSNISGNGHEIVLGAAGIVPDVYTDGVYRLSRNKLISLGDPSQGLFGPTIASDGTIAVIQPEGGFLLRHPGGRWLRDPRLAKTTFSSLSWDRALNAFTIVHANRATARLVKLTSTGGVSTIGTAYCAGSVLHAPTTRQVALTLSTSHPRPQDVCAQRQAHVLSLRDDTVHTLPRNWNPVAWSADSRALLLAHGHSLGIWYLATERFGPVTDVGVHVWMAAPIWRG